jgi:hypothetical protein
MSISLNAYQPACPPKWPATASSPPFPFVRSSGMSSAGFAFAVGRGLLTGEALLLLLVGRLDGESVFRLELDCGR